MSWWLWTKRCGIRLATGQDFTPILTCGKSQSIGRHATGVKTRHSEGRHPTCSDGAHGCPWAPLTRVQQRREGRTRAVLLALFFFRIKTAEALGGQRYGETDPALGRRPPAQDPRSPFPTPHGCPNTWLLLHPDGGAPADGTPGRRQVRGAAAAPGGVTRTDSRGRRTKAPQRRLRPVPTPGERVSPRGNVTGGRSQWL